MNSTCVDKELMPFDLARSILANAVESLSTECARLSDALGRVAAENIVAKEDLIPYARSAMNGYALSAAELPCEIGSPGVSCTSASAVSASWRSTKRFWSSDPYMSAVE